MSSEVWGDCAIPPGGAPAENDGFCTCVSEEVTSVASLSPFTGFEAMCDAEIARVLDSDVVKVPAIGSAFRVFFFVMSVQIRVRVFLQRCIDMLNKYYEQDSQ